MTFAGVVVTGRHNRMSITTIKITVGQTWFHRALREWLAPGSHPLVAPGASASRLFCCIRIWTVRQSALLTCCHCKQLTRARREILGSNRRPQETPHSAELKAIALVLLPADDPFGRRTVEPVLPLIRAVSATGLPLHRLWPLSASRGTSSPRIGAFHFCWIGI
jgi:hypothetical protein